MKRSALINKNDNARGFTALFCSAGSGHVDAVKKLLEHRADINIPDNKSDTLLRMTKRRGGQDIISLLEKAMEQQALLDELNANIPELQ